MLRTWSLNPGLSQGKDSHCFLLEGCLDLFAASELVVIARVAAVFFGQKQLPRLGKKLG